MQDQQHRRSLDFRFLAEPTDVNLGGKVHGGIVMKWMDQAGSTALPSGVDIIVSLCLLVVFVLFGPFW